MNRNTFKINQAGHLEIGGCDVVELAKQYQTPFYLFDEQKVRDNIAQYQDALQALDNYEIIYAGKALLTVGICKLMAKSGLGLDVVSGGELYVAMAADFPPERIYFHGNNKSQAELEYALDVGVGRIVVDNIAEMKLLSNLATKSQQTANILLRVMPGVEAQTHSYIQTGQLDSKFGISVAHNQVLDAVKLAASLPNLNLKGLHCHIGSQIFELASYAATIDIMVGLLAQVKNEGIILSELDLGGGLGIQYLPEDQPTSIADFGQFFIKALSEAVNKYDLAMPKIMIEPGRSLVGDAGTTVYQVGVVKQQKGGRIYAAVDGGMGDNPRVALYQAKYHAIVANKAEHDPEELYTIVGKYCESGDVLINNIHLPKLESGDILAIPATGAYNYAMASNYNSVPRLPIINVYQGESDLIVKRETYADLVRLHRVPSRWM